MSSPPTGSPTASSSFRPPTAAGARTSTAPRSCPIRRRRPAALARAKQDEASNIVVDPYAIAVEERNGHLAPKALREAIRAAGPTIRRDLGKQAQGWRPAPVPRSRRRPTMYRYDEFDAAFVAARVEQFRDQVARRLTGELTEEQFRPHRLMNGLYLQLHAYMLRVAVPYGTLNSRQMRKLADIARNYDRGYGHFTTRQNIQFNWPALKDTPDILAELASVEMHAIQTSGNCIRNITADHFAGVAPTRSPIRALTRKSCANGRRCIPNSRSCRASSRSPSTAPRTIAPRSRRTTSGCRSCATKRARLGFTVYVGGGLGRTPMIGRKVREFLPERDLLGYVDAILRVYNLEGRRDNKYKARIKILVHEKGLEALREAVEAEFAARDPDALTLRKRSSREFALSSRRPRSSRRSR